MTVQPATLLRGTGSPTAPAVRVVECATLGDRAAEWDALVVASPLPSPFLRSWWLGGLDPSRRPHFVLVLAGDRLVGGLALQRRRILGTDLLTVLGGGTLCPDHLDLLAAPGDRSAVVAAVRDWFDRPGARVLDLDGLREDALALEIVPGARVTATSLARWEHLPESVDDYFDSLSTSFLKKVRKARRRLDAGGVTIRRTAVRDVPAALDAFATLHAARADRLPLLRHMSEIRRFVLAGVDRDEAAVFEAVRAGRRCAVFVGFTTAGRWSTYQLARSLDHDLRDLGTVLRVVAVEDAVRSGLTEVDCLRGDEPHKHSFTTRSRGLLRVRAARGLRGRALLAVVTAGAAVRRTAGRVSRSARRDASEADR